MSETSSQQVLACPMRQPNDADAATVRDYLVQLLAKVWREGSNFDGKRPFGNSDWDGELYAALGQAGLIRAVFDEDGYLDEVDDTRADELIDDAIGSL